MNDEACKAVAQLAQAITRFCDLYEKLDAQVPPRVRRKILGLSRSAEYRKRKKAQNTLR